MAWSKARRRGDASAAEQGDLEFALELLGQELAQQRLAGARRAHQQPHAFGPLETSRQGRSGGLDAGGRIVLVHCAAHSRKAAGSD